MLQNFLFILKRIFFKAKGFKISTYVIIYACIYISISHIALPVFQTDDFFIFSKWSLFNYSPNEESYDLTWDNGNTFLFRDHRHKAMFQNMNLQILWYLANTNRRNLRKLKEHYSQSLYKVCNCKKIELVTIEGSLYNLLFSKNPPKIIKKEIL